MRAAARLGEGTSPANCPSPQARRGGRGCSQAATPPAAEQEMQTTTTSPPDVEMADYGRLTAPGAHGRPRRPAAERRRAQRWAAHSSRIFIARLLRERQHEQQNDGWEPKRDDWEQKRGYWHDGWEQNQEYYGWERKNDGWKHGWQQQEQRHDVHLNDGGWQRGAWQPAAGTHADLKDGERDTKGLAEESSKLSSKLDGVLNQLTSLAAAVGRRRRRRAGATGSRGGPPLDGGAGEG